MTETGFKKSTAGAAEAPERGGALGLVLVLLFSLAAHLGVASLGRVGVVDEIIYGELGRQLFAGHGYTIPYFEIFRWVHVPGFPFLMGLLAPYFHNPEGPATALYVVFGTLLSLPIYGIAARLYGRRAGWYAAALVAVIPQLLSYVERWFYGSMTEPTFNFLIFSGLYFMLVAEEDESPAAGLMAGLSLGLSYMIRVEGVIYCGLFGLWLLWRFARDRKVFRAKPFATLALAAVAMGFSIVPYVLWLHGETGRWLLTGKSVAVFAYYEGGTANADPQDFQKKLNTLNADKTAVGQKIDIRNAKVPGFADFIRADPMRMVKFAVSNYMAATLSVFTHKVFPPYLLPLVGLGLFGLGAWSAQRAKREFFLLLSFAPVALLIANLWLERYFSPAVPTLALWAGAGFMGLDRWWSENADQRRGWTRAALGAARYLPHLVVFTLLLGIAVMRPLDARRTGKDPWEYKRVAAWMTANIPDVAAKKVMSQTPQVPWYTGSEFVPCPFAPWKDVLTFAGHVGADYLVVDEYSIAQVPDDRRGLLDPAQAGPELALVRDWDLYGRKTVLYKFVNDRPPESPTP